MSRLFLAPLIALILIVSSESQKEAGKKPFVAGCGFDIAFVLDRSESVTELNFPKVKSFVKGVIQSLSNELSLGVGGEEMRFALIPFNSEAEVTLYLDQSSSLQQVLAAVDSLHYFPGLSNPYDAMSKALNEVFTQARGDRADASNALIFVSDGSRTMGTPDPTILANEFRATQNGQVIAVGVEGLNGPHQGVFYQELIGMAGTPRNVFNVTSYDGLFRVFRDVSASLNC